MRQQHLLSFANRLRYCQTRLRFDVAIMWPIGSSQQYIGTAGGEAGLPFLFLAQIPTWLLLQIGKIRELNHVPGIITSPFYGFPFVTSK